jgi:hypothetical protein
MTHGAAQQSAEKLLIRIRVRLFRHTQMAEVWLRGCGKMLFTRGTSNSSALKPCLFKTEAVRVFKVN